MRPRVGAGDRTVGLGRLFAALLVFVIGLNGVIPLFRIYGDDFGLSTGDKTLVFGIYAIGVIPGLMVFGRMSDRHGRRVILIPALIAAIGASLVLATANDLTDLVIGRLVQGLAGGAFWGPIGAFARDLTPDSRRRDAMLLITMTAPLGTALGTGLFGLIGAATDSTAVPWLLHAAVMVPVVALFATIPAVRPQPDADAAIAARIGVSRANRPIFFGFLLPVMLGSCVGCAFSLALAPDLLSAAGGSSSPAAGGAAAASVMIVSFLTQALTRRVERMFTLGLVAVASAVVGLVAMSAPETIRQPGLWVALAFVGVGFGLGFRAVMVVAEHVSLPSTRAATLAACVVAQYSGTAGGPLAGGYLADATSISVSLLTIAAFCTCALVIAARYVASPHGRTFVALGSDGENAPFPAALSPSE